MQRQWAAFASLGEAKNQTRGNTQSAVILVEQNLYVDERAEWVATASVNDYGDWHDGVVVLTDQRIFAAYTHQDLQQTYGNMIPRHPAPHIAQFQGGGAQAHFEIAGLPLQAIALDPSHLGKLKELIQSAASDSGGASSFAQLADDPMAALKTAKDLLDGGLITQEEYDQKKQEILSRL